MTEARDTFPVEVRADSGGRAPLQDADPRSPRERYMASLWAEIIGVESDLLPSDTFLSVGGNSLTLQVILTRICSELGVSLEPHLFFDSERSSLSHLARELDAVLAAASTSA